MNTTSGGIRWSPDPQGSHISGATTGLIVRFVRDRCGPQGVERLLELAGGGLSAGELSDPAGWVSYDRAVALFEAAVEVSGDPSAGWAIGEETLRQHSGTPVEALLRSLGSPGEVLRNIAGATSKFAAISTMEAVEVGEDRARVSARCLPGFTRHPIFCDYVAGQLSQIPLLFGLEQGIVVEEECQTRGADRCLYYVRWGEAGTEARTRLLEGQLKDLSTQMEALQSIATSLVSADDIDSVLSSIATRAAYAVRAQGYLLAVRAVEGGPVLVHHHGLGAEQVEALVPLLLGTAPSTATSQLMVDVVSSRRHYGRLLAVGPSGIGFFEAEKKLFAAYAEMAAAALDGATALEDARQRADTTALLLNMARDLANTAEVDQLCRQAADLVPAVVGCDKGAVFLYDHDSDRLTTRALAGFGPEPPKRLVEYVVSRNDTPELATMVADPGPRLYRLGHDDPVVERAFDLFGVAAYALVPVMVRGEFAGILAAGWREAPQDHFDHHIAERMAGLADQVASSLVTATLIEQTRHQALHDRLTGLANQALLEEHVRRDIQRCRRSGTSMALLFCDLDGFKAVNDALGHAAGDQLLRLVSQRLVSVTRANDCVARLGGDEFVVVLDGADDEAAAGAAASLIEALQSPFVLDGADVYARVSVGVAVYPRDGDDLDSLLGAADEAMYSAKREGRNAFRHFSSYRTERGRSDLSLESDLVRALESDSLAVHYQPEVDLESGWVSALEALVRWPHPRMGMILPGAFLGMAADRGLIRDVDRFVVHRACADAAARALAGRPVPVAVNLSEFHFSDPGALVDLILSALGNAGLAPELLELEIIETVNLVSSESVLEVLKELRDRGVRLCIDDFGTGYSILDRLRQLPVDKIKVAREFLEPSGAALLETISNLCRAVGAEAVAEGIETPEQLKLARDTGFCVGQGYLLGRPAPVESAAVFDVRPARLGAPM